MTTGRPRGTFALAGFTAGALVGLGDGLWAGLAASAGVRGTLAAAVLTAAVDGLLALLVGGGVELLVRFGGWGRRVHSPRWARALSALVVGVGAGAVTAAVVLLELQRRNRFLAGGEAALAGIGCALVGAAIAPGLARAFARRQGMPAGPAAWPASLTYAIVIGPLIVGLVGVGVAWGVMALRPGIPTSGAAPRAVLAAVETALLPLLLMLGERIPLRLRPAKAWAVSTALVVAPLVGLASWAWADHLRFLPWVHIVPSAFMAALAPALFLVVGARVSMAATRRLAMGSVAAAVALTVILTVSELEQARKLTATRVGVVGPALAGGRRVLDRDSDGFSPLLGGGDCDDGDPGRYPGALDVPDDGADQDCDGRDASFAALAPGPFAPVPDAVPRDLNLLLVTVDTIRADHLGCYGYGRPTSPEMDALASAGGLFVNGWAHAPSTRYSMPAIATGRWPSAITWDETIWWPRIASGVPTVAEALKAAGYVTGAYYSFDYFSPTDRRGFERGVDHYRADRAALHRAVNGPMESHGSSSREMADDTIAFLEAHGAEKFFLWVHFYDPHLSYETHADVPAFGSSRVDRYDGEIRFTDGHLGRVFRRLRELGLWDRTAVFLTGDHGEGFGEHGVTEHGFDLYAPQTRVPFIVRVPGLAPRRITNPVGHVDLAPTMLNLARAPQNPSFLGRSLVADLAGAPPASPQVGSPAPRPVFQEVSSERGKKRALVTADTHLLWNWTPENTTECYDLRTDPDERRDLWGTRGDATCRALKVELQGMVSALAMPPDVARKLRTSVFTSAAVAPPPPNPLDVRVGDVLRIIGYSLNPPPAGGGEGQATIHFESLKPIGGGWRFFFHLTGPGGFRNLDHVPVEGAMPPERWRPGQVVVDRVGLPFPAGTPPGMYTLSLGLYRGAERMEVSPAAAADGNRAVRLLTFNWGP